MSCRRRCCSTCPSRPSSPHRGARYLRAAHELVATLGDGEVDDTGTLVRETPALDGDLTGWGLWTFRPWARIVGIMLAALSLPSFPIGTLMGIYALVMFFKKDPEALFVRPA